MYTCYLFRLFRRVSSEGKPVIYHVPRYIARQLSCMFVARFLMVVVHKLHMLDMLLCLCGYTLLLLCIACMLYVCMINDLIDRYSQITKLAK
jgi:hypothetical protein